MKRHFLLGWLLVLSPTWSDASELDMFHTYWETRVVIFEDGEALIHPIWGYSFASDKIDLDLCVFGTAFFVNKSLLEQYGADWTGVGTLALSTLLNYQLFRESRQTNSWITIAAITTFFNLATHLRMGRHWGPLFVGTGYDTDFFIWKEQALIWTPFWTVGVRFVPGFWICGRGEWTFCKGTGPLPGKISNKSTFGFDIGFAI